MSYQNIFIDLFKPTEIPDMRDIDDIHFLIHAACDITALNTKLKRKTSPQCL